jgi:cellulose synthase/poly-beta-1,6-N-acetylglucosamine synthase-like glycosyltransferase
MTLVALLVVTATAALFYYAYVFYPLVLYGASRGRGVAVPGEPREWPTITIVVVAHNAAPAIRRTLEHLIAADYPRDRRQILVVSDASTDGTDAIAGEFASEGVELHRLERRSGKTAAENAAAHLVRGDIVVCTDATLIVPSGSVKALVRHFTDPRIGVVSGRGVSIANTADADAATATLGEARYLDYETRVRSLEARFGSIMGATGQLYAQRRELFEVALSPTFLTRDFASALIAHERGYRSLQDEEAQCLVVRNASLRREYERKARTIVLGLDTLFHYPHLLDPMRYGWFAFMLLSHKLCRWLVYLLAPLALAGLFVLAVGSAVGYVTLLVGLAAIAAGLVGIYWPRGRPVPTLLSSCGFAVALGAAGLSGWLRFLRGEHATTWNPTERVAGSG